MLTLGKAIYVYKKGVYGTSLLFPLYFIANLKLLFKKQKFFFKEEFFIQVSYNLVRKKQTETTNISMEE